MSNKQVTGKISLMDSMSAPLKRITQQMERTSQAARQLNSSLRIQNTGAAALQQTTQRTAQLTQQTQRFNVAMQQTNQQANQTSDSVRRTGQSAVEAGNGMSQLQQRFGGVSERNARMLNGLEQAQGALLTTGVVAGAAGGAVVAGLGASVKTAADFEAAMSKVAAVSGASKVELGQLTEQAKELGAKTKYSASEAAEGMQFLAMAGFKTGDIMKAMPGMLDLAAAGALDLGRAADISSNIMSGFGIEAGKAGHVADVLAKAAASANTDVSQLGEAMKYLAPTAKSVGWGMEESTAAVMAMSDAGIQGSLAGQAFGSSLTRLASPTKAMRKVMESLNLSFFDSNGVMKPLPALVSDIQDKTKGLTMQQKASALSTLFGAEAYKHWAVLVEKGGDALGKNTQMLQQADGAAAKMAQTMNDNLNGQIIELQSGLEGAAIALGDALLPAIKLVVSGLQSAVSWFNGLSQGTKTTIAVVAVIIGTLIAFGGALAIVAALIPSIVSGFTLMAGVFGVTAGALATTIGIAFGVVTAIIAVGAAIVVLYNKSTTFRNIVNGAIAGVKSAFDSLMNKVGQVKTFLTSTWNGIKAIFSGNEGKGASILGSLGFGPETIKTVMTISTNIKLAIASIKALVSGNDTKAGGFLRTLGFSEGAIGVIFSVKSALSSVMNTVKGFSALLGGNEGKAVSLLSRAGLDPATIRQSIGVINNVKNAVKGLFDIFKGNTKQGVSFLKMAGLSPDMIGQITSTISSVKQAFSGIVSVVKSVASQIASAFKGSGPVIMSSLSTIVKSIITIFRTLQPVLSVVFNVIKIIVVGALQNLAGFIKGVTGVILAIVKIFSSLLTGNWRGLWEGIKSLFTNALMAIWNGVQLLFLGRLFGVFKAGFTALKAIFTGGWAAIRNGFMTGLTTIWNGAKSIFTKSINGLGNALSAGFRFMFNGAVTIVRGYINILQSVINFGFNFIRNIITTILQVVLNIFRASWSGIVQVVSSAVSALRSAISAGLNAAGAFIRSIWSNVSSFTSSTWSAMRTGVSNALSGMLNAVKTILGNIKSFFQSTWQNILNTVKELPGKFLAYGKAIINGLWDGIKSAAAGLGDKVAGLIDSIVPAPVKNLLGINSPSKLFRQYGIWTIQGLEGGMEERQDKARQSAVNVAKEITVPFAPTGKGNTSYTSNNANHSQKNYTTNEFNVTISADAARAMNTDDATFKELADKFINYVADKLDDVNNSSTKVNLGVMEQ